jgi:hypothetical protein
MLLTEIHNESIGSNNGEQGCGNDRETSTDADGGVRELEALGQKTHGHKVPNKSNHSLERHESTQVTTVPIEFVSAE